MKRLLCVAVCLLFYEISFSQERLCDTIILNSGKNFTGKVVEINPKELKYKKCEFLDGPAFLINTVDVFRVNYANGTNSIISEILAIDSMPNLDLRISHIVFIKKQNFLYVNPVQLAFISELNLGYEWRFAKKLCLNLNVGNKFHSIYQSILKSPPSFSSSYYGPRFSLGSKYFLFNEHLFIGPVARLSYLMINNENFYYGIDRYTGVYNLSSYRTDLDLGLTLGFANFGRTSNLQFFIASGIKNTWAQTTYYLLTSKYPNSQMNSDSYAGPILNGYYTNLYFQIGLIASFFGIEKTTTKTNQPNHN